MDEAEVHAVGPPPTALMDGDQQVHAPVVSNADVTNKSEWRRQKKIWLLTYCPAGTYITPEMLKESNIIVDECHTTCDRVMNYTYLHLPKPCRLGQIEKFFEKANLSHMIVKKEVYGYEAIGSQGVVRGTSIQEHIAFKMLLKHFNEVNSAFLPWTEGEKVLKRGHLFQATEMIGETTMSLANRTKSQVIAYARELEEKVRQNQEFGTLYFKVMEEREELVVENASLKRKLQTVEDEKATLNAKIAAISSQNDGLVSEK